MTRLTSAAIIATMFRTLGFIVAVAAALAGCEKKASEAPRPAPETPVKADDEPPQTALTPLSADVIGKAAATEATVTDDGVVRIGWTRDDVAVKVDGTALPPAAGLGSWAAFQPARDGAMVMGDTVVFQDEISPAMDAAFAAGLEVSALHNHFAFDEPPVYFMHIGGHGDPAKLAKGVKNVWDAIKNVRSARKQPASAFPGPTVKPGTLDANALTELIGHDAGEKPGGVVKVVVERKATMHGVEFGGSMGLTTWAAFTGDDALASIDGDFAMTAAEVQPVLRALRAADIHVVALHNHMIGEDPAYYFVHFWGKGPAAALAKGFRSALEAQRNAPRGH